MNKIVSVAKIGVKLYCWMLHLVTLDHLKKLVAKIRRGCFYITENWMTLVFGRLHLTLIKWAYHKVGIKAHWLVNSWVDELRSKYRINDFYFYISNNSLDDSLKQLCLQVELHVDKMFFYIYTFPAGIYWGVMTSITGPIRQL